MRLHHRREVECFAEHDDRLPENGSNTNQCNPNSNCQMIVGMPFPLVPAHGMCSKAVLE